MRGREFVMKDLYTFDTDLNAARQTYDAICTSYDAIFKTIGVQYVKGMFDYLNCNNNESNYCISS